MHLFVTFLLMLTPLIYQDLYVLCPKANNVIFTHSFPVIKPILTHNYFEGTCLKNNDELVVELHNPNLIRYLGILFKCRPKNQRPDFSMPPELNFGSSKLKQENE